MLAELREQQASAKEAGSDDFPVLLLFVDQLVEPAFLLDCQIVARKGVDLVLPHGQPLP